MSKKPLKKPVNFNPRSREGSDGLYKYQTILLPRISIHAPARGATRARYRVIVLETNFNPRSREGSD